MCLRASEVRTLNRLDARQAPSKPARRTCRTGIHATANRDQNLILLLLSFYLLPVTVFACLRRCFLCLQPCRARRETVVNACSFRGEIAGKPKLLTAVMLLLLVATICVRGATALGLLSSPRTLLMIGAPARNVSAPRCFHLRFGADNETFVLS